MGCHFQNISNTAAQLNNRYVLRSTELGTIRVHPALNPGRAITVCCNPNTPISKILIAMARRNGVCVPESIDFERQKFPMKQNIYANVSNESA
jgi:hypothetical protein